MESSYKKNTITYTWQFAYISCSISFCPGINYLKIYIFTLHVIAAQLRGTLFEHCKLHENQKDV